MYGLLLAESADENGILEITDKKIADLFKSLMIEQTPKWLKTYKAPERMDFINFNDKQEDETEQSFIDRQFPSIAKAMNDSINAAKKRGKQFGLINEGNWSNSDYVHV